MKKSDIAKRSRINNSPDLREKMTKHLTDLINHHGSPYKASKAIKISPSAFYERMYRVGLDPKGYDLLKGEPSGGKQAKKIWLLGLLKEYDYNVNAVAHSLDRSPSAIHCRIESYGITTEVRDAVRSKKEFTEVFHSFEGDVKLIADKFKVSTQTVYARIKKYDLSLLQSSSA